jgi:hypothetical protein
VTRPADRVFTISLQDDKYWVREQGNALAALVNKGAMEVIASLDRSRLTKKAPDPSAAPAETGPRAPGWHARRHAHAVRSAARHDDAVARRLTPGQSRSRSSRSSSRTDAVSSALAPPAPGTQIGRSLYQPLSPW